MPEFTSTGSTVAVVVLLLGAAFVLSKLLALREKYRERRATYGIVERQSKLMGIFTAIVALLGFFGSLMIMYIRFKAWMN